MMIHALLLLAALSSATPVHVALRPAATVTANADGFVTLGSIASLSGGAASTRARLSTIVVARAPLPGDVRRLTRGDLSLKLRQAGCDPDHAAVLEGAAASTLTTSRLPDAAPAALALPAPAPPAAEAAPPVVPAVSIVHRGDAVTIQNPAETLSITAAGIARENGGVGDIIRVHRDGVMTDLTVRVLDAQTVQMEL